MAVIILNLNDVVLTLQLCVPKTADWKQLGSLQYIVTIFKNRIIFKDIQVRQKEKTRAVRGSDYSPAIVLSEEKDKFVTENWREWKMPQ